MPKGADIIYKEDYGGANTVLDIVRQTGKEIKEKVDSGNYKVDHLTAAQRLAKFFKGES
ncbi:hypothetical protein [Halobacillus sp. Marseille-Q1614]|uniref:hypothetical protein n=1 Tax=Halobacillus sp. Marseille-Q1614 TaxID=2709134 RepID=UPI00157113C4|nr:hypothetical protein [Halobacillus sp. Marseille-Q1614]